MAFSARRIEERELSLHCAQKLGSQRKNVPATPTAQLEEFCRRVYDGAEED